MFLLLVTHLDELFHLLGRHLLDGVEVVLPDERVAFLPGRIVLDNGVIANLPDPVVFLNRMYGLPLYCKYEVRSERVCTNVFGLFVGFVPRP